MRIFAPGFVASLTAARDGSISPAWFFWIEARDRSTGAVTPVGLWSGDEDISVAVETPTGGTVTRIYVGQVGLSVDGLVQVMDLTDNPVTVAMSQIADAAQLLARGYDPRLAHCEIHATSMNGGAFVSVPQLMFVGIVDDGPISTPAAGGEGGIALTVRSEIMSQLTAINPTKSSDEQQRRRSEGDRFSEYSSTVSSRTLQWYKG